MIKSRCEITEEETHHLKLRTVVHIDWYIGPVFGRQSNEIRKCCKNVMDRFSVCTEVGQKQGKHISFLRKLIYEINNETDVAF